MPATALCRVQFLHAHDGARANHCLGLHGGRGRRDGNMGCSVGGCGVALSAAAVSVVVVTVVVFSSLLSCEAPRGGCLIRPERSARATSPSAGDRTSLFSDVSPPGVTRPARPRGLARAGREEDGSGEATLQ